MPKRQTTNNPSNGGLWGIMGGTFDPIHLGHLMMAESVMHSIDADGMLFVPARTHPFKAGEKLSAFADRVGMVEAAIAANNRFRLEYPPEHSGFTIDLIDYVRHTYPAADLFLPIGSDIIGEFTSWHKHDEIEQSVRILVAARPGYRQKKSGKGPLAGTEWVNIPQYEISSSDIRSRVKMNMSIRYMVPEAVEKYIYEKRLYAG